METIDREISLLAEKFKHLAEENEKLKESVKDYRDAWYSVRDKVAESRQYFYLLGFKDHERGFSHDSRKDLVTLSKEKIKELLK